MVFPAGVLLSLAVSSGCRFATQAINALSLFVAQVFLRSSCLTRSQLRPFGFDRRVIKAKVGEVGLRYRFNLMLE
jgi:hypothetical protein